MRVEVLYKGKGTKWFSGKISRVNRDGTYDIRYDDGDSESGALSSNVRKHPDAGGGGSRPAALREGMKVEARYRGKEKYYPGVIRRENRDGTFDIDYNDVRIVGAFSHYTASYCTPCVPVPKHPCLHSPRASSKYAYHSLQCSIMGLTL